MLENATRICDARFGILYRYANEAFESAALFGAPTALAEFLQRQASFRPEAGSGLDRVLRTKDVVRKADALAEQAPGASVKFGGARSLGASGSNPARVGDRRFHSRFPSLSSNRRCRHEQARSGG